MKIGSTHIAVTVPGSEEGTPQLFVIFRDEEYAPPPANRKYPAGTKFVRGNKGIADLSSYPYAVQKLLAVGLPHFWRVEGDAEEAMDGMPEKIKEEYLEAKAQLEARQEAERAASVGKRAPRTAPRN